MATIPPKVGNLYLMNGNTDDAFIFEIVKIDPSSKQWWWQSIGRDSRDYCVSGPCILYVIENYTLIYETPEAG